MKKLIFMALLLIAAVSAHADEQRKVKLNSYNSKETVRLAFCNFFVTKNYSNDDGSSTISIEIENLDESNVIILFGHAYPEKDLKKLRPSIRYDKNFPGNKGHRDLKTYQEARDVIFIEPSEKRLLPNLEVRDGEIRLCSFPLYIAKYQNKQRNKMLLLTREIIELEIETTPDKDYVRLESICNTLVDSISKLSFCSNSKHKPSLAKQKESCQKRINQIKAEIDEIIARHNWDTNDKIYQKYYSIKMKLDSIDFSNLVRDCGKHRTNNVPSHRCKYCNLSLQQIYHKLDDHYKKIYNSSDRKASKNAIISDVNLLYRCCTDKNCQKHASAWKSSEYKSKITDRYNRINNF